MTFTLIIFAENIVLGTVKLVPQLQSYVTSLEKEGFEIIGHCRKSSNVDNEEILVNLLQRMTNLLYERSLFDKVFVVIRKAKDILDSLVDILPNSMSDNRVGWSLLIAGATCSISCLYLDANGLYVNIPKFDFSLPANFLELPTFADTLVLLLTFRREIYSLADALENKLSQKLSVIHALGRQDDVQVFNAKTFWKRGTYYTPPAEIASVAPKYLFGSPPTESILQKLKKLAPKDATIDDLGNNDKERDIDSSIASDEFGWAKTGSHWYNRFTNEISEPNPYADEESD
jgi:hypothetical protein